MNKIKLPERYEVVTVYDIRRGKEIGEHILDYDSESNALFLFTEDGTFQYTRNEVEELFELYNQDGAAINIFDKSY